MATMEWPVRVFVTEQDGYTKARVVLHAEDEVLTAEGFAASQSDERTPSADADLAVSRALAVLGSKLVERSARSVARYGQSFVMPDF
jgi:hypothetical protein